MKEIVLDYHKDKELFNETAKGWAEAIGSGKGGVQNTQMRKFYNKVLELNDKAKDIEFKEEILPFVKMLNSKVEYALTRKVASPEFKDMMNQCIAQVNSKEDLKTFKLFFEAVVGFYKGRD